MNIGIRMNWEPQGVGSQVRCSRCTRTGGRPNYWAVLESTIDSKF